MSTAATMTIMRGQDESYEALIESDEAPYNLDLALEMELVIKQSPGDDEPALLTLTREADGGLTPRTQAGDDIGYVDIEITSAQTFALPAARALPWCGTPSPSPSKTPAGFHHE